MTKKDPTLSIWKYPIPVEYEVSLEMPVHARILCVQLQRGVPCLWAWVDTEAKKETRKFLWFGTGHPQVRGEYIGTV